MNTVFKIFSKHCIDVLADLFKRKLSDQVGTRCLGGTQFSVLKSEFFAAAIRCKCKTSWKRETL